ncbi:MAG: iron ABC transporter permease [Thaumarchaeota archaeon]|nr:iron ABC transporter permease [Nitrososphaerota archaeon]
MRLTTNPVSIVFWAVLAFTIFLIIYPISFLLYGSLWSSDPGDPGYFTLIHYITAFSDPYTVTLLSNSFTYALGSALLAVSIGSILAFIAVRTDAPLRRQFRFLPFLPIVLPGFVDNLAWLYLFSPRSGLANVMFRDLIGITDPLSDVALFNIYSMAGMIWVMGISLVPTSYLVISAAFTAMDSSLEEAARVAGSRITTIIRKITVPIMLPAILSVFLLVFIIAFESFETPAMIGLPARIDVFMSEIYRAVVGSIPPNYGLATAHAMILLLITLSLIFMYRRSVRRAEKFQVITGKGYHPRIIHLGKWKYLGTGILVTYLVVHIGLMFSTVALLSFQPFWNPRDLLSNMTLKHYYLVFDRSDILRSLINSWIVCGAAASIVLLMAAMISYISRRSTFRWKGLLEGVGTLPIAFPGFVIGLGFLWTFLTLPLQIYGTLIVIVLAFLVKYLPHGIRFTAGAVVQIHRDLEESSSIVGAQWTTTVRRITLPLLRSAMFSGWIYVFVISFKELSSIIFLITPRNEVLATTLWDLWVNGSVEILAAASVLLTVLLWIIVFISINIFRLRLR